MGALLNEKAGSGMAKGIGIQVLKDGSRCSLIRNTPSAA
jgi:hypothetical protein